MASSTRGFLSSVARSRSRGLNVGNRGISSFLQQKLAEEARASAQAGETAANSAEKRRQFDVSTAEDKRQFNLQEARRGRAEQRERDAAKASGVGDLVSGAFNIQKLATEAGFGEFGPIGLAKSALSGSGLLGAGKSLLTKGGEAIGGLTSKLAGTLTGAGTGGAASSVAGAAAGAGTGATTALTDIAAGAGAGPLGEIGGAVAGEAAGGIGKGLLGSGIIGGGLLTKGLAGAGIGLGAEALLGSLGANEELAAGLGGAAGGLIAGGPLGAVIGGTIGLVKEWDSFQKEVMDDLLGFDGGTIICTELHRQGELDVNLRNLSRQFGQEKIPREVYEGYLIMAKPIVEKMRKSKRFTKFTKFIATPIIKELAHCVDSNVKGTLFGKLVKTVFIPICGRVGSRAEGGMEWAS